MAITKAVYNESLNNKKPMLKLSRWRDLLMDQRIFKWRFWAKSEYKRKSKTVCHKTSLEKADNTKMAEIDLPKIPNDFYQLIIPINQDA